jgi:hypothetical protein
MPERHKVWAKHTKSDCDLEAIQFARLAENGNANAATACPQFCSSYGKSPDRLILRDFRIDTSIPREHLSKVAAIARGDVQQST